MRTRGRQRSGTLVGRGGEVAELDRGLDRVGRGVPWFLEIVVEPGIGKTRLLAELGLHSEQRGWLVLEGRAAEFERDVPCGLIVDALNDRLSPRPRTPCAALARRAGVGLPVRLPLRRRGAARGVDSRAPPHPVRDPLAPRAAGQSPADRPAPRRRALGRRRLGRADRAPRAPFPRPVARRDCVPAPT